MTPTVVFCASLCASLWVLLSRLNVQMPAMPDEWRRSEYGRNPGIGSAGLFGLAISPGYEPHPHSVTATSTGFLRTIHASESSATLFARAVRLKGPTRISAARIDCSAATASDESRGTRVSGSSSTPHVSSAFGRRASQPTVQSPARGQPLRRPHLHPARAAW